MAYIVQIVCPPFLNFQKASNIAPHLLVSRDIVIQSISSDEKIFVIWQGTIKWGSQFPTSPTLLKSQMFGVLSCRNLNHCTPSMPAPRFVVHTPCLVFHLMQCHSYKTSTKSYRRPLDGRLDLRLGYSTPATSSLGLPFDASIRLST